jgi:hypothetical protein
VGFSFGEIGKIGFEDVFNVERVGSYDVSTGTETVDEDGLSWRIREVMGVKI